MSSGSSKSGGKRAGYTTVNGEKIYNSAPKGFKMVSNGGTTGIETWTNGKSLFSGERKTIKVKGDNFSEYYNKNGQPTAKTLKKMEKRKAEIAENNKVRASREQSRQAKNKVKEKRNTKKIKSKNDIMNTVFAGGINQETIYY